MTFLDTPPTYASVNSPLIWTVYDANAIDPLKVDYRYVGELWIDGVKVYTERSVPRPSGAFGFFDFSTIIRSYVNATFNPTTTALISQLSGEMEFRTPLVVIKIREDFNSTTGAIVLTGAEFTFYNHYNERQDILTSIEDYIDRALTNRGMAIQINEDVQVGTSDNGYFIPYFNTNLSSYDVVLNGTTYTITPGAINLCSLINIKFAVPTTVLKYDAVINGEVYKVERVCNGLYKNYTIHFLNKYGGFESMLFNKVSRKRLQIERKEYKQQPYRINSSGIVSYGVTNVRHDQRTQFATKFDEKLKLQTDFISDADYQWLYQLVCSPQVYLEDEGVIYPVIVTDSNYEYKEHIVDSLTTLSIDVEMTGNNNTQFR